jgi:glutathione synthase/RimK-type ligase-like ATP-grasp enzyme
MTVLVWGPASDPPIELVLGALAQRGADIALVDPQDARYHRLTASFEDGALAAMLSIGGRDVPLAPVTGAYLRPIEVQPTGPATDSRGPSAASDAGPPARFHQAMVDLTETLAFEGRVRVLNPLSAMSSNMSKPYQAQTIVQCGFSTPDTLLTDDPDEVARFVARYPSAVYKSASGVRSIVSSLADTDPARLRMITWCPVQFQERVDGFDVRVHVVGERTFAARVISDALDYRYAGRQVGANAELEASTVPPDVNDKCVRLAQRFGLPFAGIDLKFCPDGRVVCFEVNPSPGFSYYEMATGLPIAAAVADELLAGGRND